MPRMLTVGAMLLAACAAAAQSTRPATIDAIVEAPIAAGRVAGGSVAVVQGERTIVERGYPAEDLTAVVLFNTAGPVNPQTIAREIADELLGT